MRLRALIIACALACQTVLLAESPNPLGFDMGWSPERTVAVLTDLKIDHTQGSWLRIRGMGGSAVVPAPEEGRRAAKDREMTDQPLDSRIMERRTALHQLRERGHRLVAMLRWSSTSWDQGSRDGRAHLPLNLNDAYKRCRDLALTYGDLIDAWEIDNEPDIMFIPENAETFAAFYKACSLGILAGRELAEAEDRGRRPEDRRQKTDDSERRESNLVGSTGTFPPSHLSSPRAPSSVMHSPMALPPGPYWHELVANDTLSYTEAFNYHYYGFAEDFRGVRNAWVAALEAAQRVGQPTVGPATAGSKSAAGKVSRAEGVDSSNLSATTDTLQAKPVPSDLPTSPDATRPDESAALSAETSVKEEPSAPKGADLDRPLRPLPIFLTEYGYGLLDRFDRDTIAGRERQKQFFANVLPSITDGTITGAMAFVFMPYYERGVNEFGLLAEVTEDLRSVLQEQQSGKVSPAPSKYEDKASKNPPTSSLAEHSHLIRAADTFPLLTNGRRPSPIVIDFIAGVKTRTIKRYNGHILGRIEDASGKNANTLKSKTLKSESSGDFTLVLYNFSDEPVTGTLSVLLENGHVEQAPIGGTTTVSSAMQTTTSPDPAHARKDESAAPVRQSNEDAAEDPPYRRPDTPRSGFNPPTQPNWPNTDTRIVTTNSGKIYALTPALEFLLNAATQNGGASLATPTAAPSLTTEVLTTTERSDIREASVTRQSNRREGDPQTTPSESDSSVSASQRFSVFEVSLAPMERRELPFTATLPNTDFHPNRLFATFLSRERGDVPFCGNPKSVLATQLYPSPAAFRFQTLSTFDFTAKANAESRARQLARPRAEEEAALQINPAAPRWLTTAGIDIEETNTGWRITINDLPPEPLRPAEIELPLPNGWFSTSAQNAEKLKTENLKFPANAALSLKYRLDPAEPGESISAFQLSDFQRLQRDESRYEEVEINLRDGTGTLWGVWPRLFARSNWQSYLEPLRNLTPMFYSRPPAMNRQLVRRSFSEGESIGDGGSLVLLLRPRTIPTTIEIHVPRLVLLVPKDA